MTKVQSQDPLEVPPQVAEVPPIEKWDRYEILHLLGRGGMGSVWKARDRQLHRMVALKFIRGDDAMMVTRFQQEARAQARIQHRHICQVYEVGTVAAKPYIAMQLVEGKKLGDAALDMSLPHKVQVMRDVVLALHEAHRLGVLHRDLKPDKITPVEKWLSNFRVPSEHSAEVVPVCPGDPALPYASWEPAYT